MYQYKSHSAMSKNSAKRPYKNINSSRFERRTITSSNSTPAVTSKSPTVYTDFYDRIEEENVNVNNLSDFSDSDSGSDTEFEIDIEIFLRTWSTDMNISAKAVNMLLKFLKQFSSFQHLPNDCRTLLKTPRKTDIVNVFPGTYSHLGLKIGIENVLDKIKIIPKEIIVDFNIDGVPLSRSTNNGFGLFYAIFLT